MSRTREHFVFICLAGAMLLFAQLIAGCSAADGGPRDNDDRPRGNNAIPEDARAVDEGVGRLKYTARRDGRIYVYDIEDRDLVFSGTLSRSQEFVLTPDQNQATVDDKKVYSDDLKRQHHHRLYFMPDDDRPTDSNSALPRSASRVASGRGEVVYRARFDGRAYVYDADDKKIVFSQHVRSGQTIAVDPEHDRVNVDGRRVNDSNLARAHEHRIYFDKD